MRRDLAEALEAAGSDEAIRVVVITGAGRAFCAGGDVSSMAELIERHDTEEFSRLLGSARRVILAIRQMTKPVIAAVNGLGVWRRMQSRAGLRSAHRFDCSDV